MEGTIRILQERNLNNPTNKSAAPIYPVTKAKAVLNSDGKTIEEVTSDLDERLTAAEEAIDIGEVGKTLTLTEDNWEKYVSGPGRYPALIDLSRLKITKLVVENDVHYPIAIALPSTIETIDSSEYNHPISWHTNTSAAVANLKKVISYDGSELALYALKTVPELPDSGDYNLPTGSITISNPQNSYYFNTTQELYNVLYYCVTSLGGYTGRLTTEDSSSTYPESALFWGSDMHKKLQQIWDKAYYDLSTTPSFTVTFAYTQTRLFSVYQSGTRHLNNTLHCEGPLIATGSEQICGLGRIHLTIDKGSYPNAPLYQSGVGGLRFAVSTQYYPGSIIDGGTYSVSGYYGESNSNYTVTINSRTYVTHTSAYVPSVGDYVFADATCDSEQDYGKSIIGKVVNVDTTNNVAQVASAESLSFNVPTVNKYFRMWGPIKDMDTSHYPDITYTYTPDNVVIEGESRELVYVTPILDSTSTATYSTINDSTEYTAVYNAMGTGYKEAFDEVLADLGISKSTDKLMPARFNTILVMAIIKLLSKQENSGIIYPSTYEEFISGVNSAISSEDPSRALLYYPFVTTGFLFDGVHYKVGDSLVREIKLKSGETLNDQFAPTNWYLPNEAIMVMLKTAGRLDTSYVYGYAEEKDNLVLGDCFGGYLYQSWNRLWGVTTKQKAANTDARLYFYFVTTIEI